ncbi:MULTISPECIES: phosphotransferase [Mycobacteriaceae]|uniref:DUF7064 domain-containing protein n=1 Tax=Mycobacteriaceae TaxID=1762 RepID=UPI0007FE7019|nr:MULTISPECIES: phosphotransferase [Mycobacteriaceae]MCK0174314.1 ecdysteroid 22-kinase family protein [Mycolicibacterium sp. F2034L]OBB60346.1 phosphotransferase [Mycobacterium sp. 852013-51886_SCH5428379]
MSDSADLVIEQPADLTAAWLTTAIGRGEITDFAYERIGTGQMSLCYRVTLTYADSSAGGPESVVLKVAATDDASRQTGHALGLYEREVRFYTDVAPRLSGPVAPCYHAAFDVQTGVFTLLLGDASPAEVGDEIRGATVDQARLALSELGRIHAPLIGNSTLADADWLNREAPVSQALLAQLWAGFCERYADRIASEHRIVCERLVESFDAHLEAEAAADRPDGLVHGDYRLDNMLFGQAGADRPLTVVDWQTVTWGPAFTDVAYFLGCALPSDDRRAHYDDLLGAYHTELAAHTAVDLDTVRDGVRRQSFFGVMMAIISSMLVERTDRGDELFMTMLARHCAHVLDTDALAILPEPTVPEPLSPEAADEGGHDPTDDELWNESWYFDFADDRQGIGGWVRLGLYPNQGKAWVNALLCGPDMPTIALVDFEAPVPTDISDVAAEGGRLTFQTVEPLKTYRVTVRGTALAYDDPAGLLRGEEGRPADLAMDLTFTTASSPYQYRITPRYEIACTVSGSVSADGRDHTLDGVAGQRDHSWGVRDWWSMEWVWSALHLDDGTHLHGLDLRIPGAPPFGMGYVQPAGRPLAEQSAVTAEATFADTGLPVTTSLQMAPAGLTLDVDIRGYAPVLLTAEDGRVSQFPRAWGRITTADGRTGVGWLEWNRQVD